MTDGAMFMLGSCIACGMPIQFAPSKVPSVRVDGKREPLCLACARLKQKIDEERGETPAPILEDAYEPEPLNPWRDI